MHQRKEVPQTKKLSRYFTPLQADPVQARRTVNGLDRAERIAGYYAAFLHALTC
ncbi:hypothetical protein [Hymenobacter gummosus]|uniref:hypothetical protein n=1 Tax=Hymenobacter gummosus TaxID=1776032 RepID=UPI001404C1F9|nr:hypothetical protein [Hymenobacter gummosus]